MVRYKLYINNTHAMKTELKSCVKVEVAVLGSPSPIILMVSVDVNQQLKKKSKP